jgi:hypothetical protein
MRAGSLLRHGPTSLPPPALPRLCLEVDRAAARKLQPLETARQHLGERPLTGLGRPIEGASREPDLVVGERSTALVHPRCGNVRPRT